MDGGPLKAAVDKQMVGQTMSRILMLRMKKVEIKELKK